jgi:NADPH2:quinone reductase
MRAMVFDRYGEPDVMSLRETPVPEPKDGEILIRVCYAGVNPSDSKARSGQSARAGYRLRGVDFPFVTGMDAAGVVERTGSNVNGFRQGDRVITWSAADGKTWGSYAGIHACSRKECLHNAEKPEFRPGGRSSRSNLLSTPPSANLAT